MLNRFHMWFPGGIVIGSLISKVMTDLGFVWQVQMGIIVIPTIIYFFYFLVQKFPQPKLEGMTSLATSVKAMKNPVFIFLFLTFLLTSINEFGTKTWVSFVLSQSSESSMIRFTLC